MGKIAILDEQLANQIAAGEVIERPSSVVKELVENAVDAGSTTIDITIEEGGLHLIRVVDNGSGIEAEDIGTAFLRHATSKIATSRDLFRIVSLGFRGEALPSIAAVAKVTCISATDQSGLGCKYVIEGGKEQANEPINASQGTDITVRELFYNTPARLKYMKSVQTELGHIADYVNRLALAHPEITFTLKHNDHLLLQTLGNGDVLQTFAAIYGASTAKAMFAVQGEHPDYSLQGYISTPQLTRASRNAISVIVNGRYIKSFVVNQSLMQAYHTLLPINRYPLAILSIKMHPSLLDVNVHPAKMEVRFSKEPELRIFVEQAIRNVLEAKQHIATGVPETKKSKPDEKYVQGNITFHRPAQSEPPMAEQTEPSTKPGGSQPAGWLERFQAAKSDAPPTIEPPVARPTSQAPPTWRTEQPRVPRSVTEKLYAPPTGKPLHSEAPATASQEQQPSYEAAKAPQFPELYWIGQLHGTYIVAQNETGLYLIDQHAAHERIHYEYFLQKYASASHDRQLLLVPFTLEFTAAEMALITPKLELLAEVGVEAELFGQQTLLIRSHPQWMPPGEELAIVEEMIQYVQSEKGAIDIGKLREKAAIMCSCKASIKANDRLTREQGEALLQRLSTCGQPYTCPHGRPIVVHLSTYQLEKMFKRVM